MNSEQLYKDAVLDLTEAVIELTNGIEFTLEETTTNNHEEFLEENKNGLVISREGSDTSIYGSEYVNIRARVFHDMVHIREHKDFSKEHEYQVAEIQKQMVFNYLKDKVVTYRASNASKLLELDIKRQVDYYYNSKQFVGNQEEFVKGHFKRFAVKMFGLKD